MLFLWYNSRDIEEKERRSADRSVKMFKKLIGCVKGYWFFTIVTPICVLGEVGVSTLITYKIADLIDNGIKAGNLEHVKAVGTTLIMYAILAMVLGVLSGIFASIAGAGFATNVRKSMYYNVMDFSFSNVDKFSTAGLVTRMTTDVTRVQMAFMMITRMFVRIPSNLIFAMIAAFKVNKQLPLVFLFTIPFLSVGMVIIMKKAMPSFTKMFDKFDSLNRTIQENVRGIRVVKSFVREDHETEKFLDVAGEVKDLSVKAEKIVAWNAPVLNFSIYVCTLAIAWFGANMITNSVLTTGELTSVMQYIMLIITSFGFMSFMFIIGSQAAASFKRIAEVLNETSDIRNSEEPQMEVKDGSVEFVDAAFAYDKGKNVVENLNLSIKSGETIGILGGTGSGKSSLVMLIPRLYDVNAGCVKVGGTDVKNIDIETLRHSVAMVLQKNILFEGTIRENLMWGKPDATEEEMWHALSLAQAENFVRAFPDGLDTHIEQGGSNVSGGQRQRLCIARAVIGSPKILILDDSTSAVDTATEAKIREGLASFMPETTKIIIAQRISSVKDADRIVVVDNGSINGVGTHDELIVSNKIYQEVYESQTKGGDFDEPTAE